MLPVGRFTLLENHKEVNAKKRGTEGAKSPVAAISLPRGGGAIRGIGEKFSVNPVTGNARCYSLST